MKENFPLKKIHLPEDYSPTLTTLIDLIQTTQIQLLRTFNRRRHELYWQIAETIEEKQANSGWGDVIVQHLALDIQSHFPDLKGLSARNLWRMRRFYITYRDNEQLLKLAKEIGWTHNNIILESTENDQEREFYLRMCIRERWTYRELKKQIHGDLFSRFALSNSAAIELSERSDHGSDLSAHFKDEYLLDFIKLEPGYSERDLSKALVSHIREFIRELGQGFMFGGEEYVVRVGNEEFRIDMLFFNRSLQCLVAVELKIGRFKPEYLGKLEFYLAALDEQKTLPHENPAVGLLLCKGKDNDVVRLALSRSLSPIKVASYKTGLPDEKLLSQKLQSLKIPEECYPEETENFKNLYELLMFAGTCTPLQARTQLQINADELRQQVLNGKNQGWLEIKGRGRTTSYRFRGGNHQNEGK